MSFLGDAKSLFRNVSCAVISYFNNGEEEYDKVCDLDVPEKDEIVATVARRNYDLVYPSSKFSDLYGPLINTTSLLNGIISSVASILISLSVIVPIYFVFIGVLFPFLVLDGLPFLLGTYTATFFLLFGSTLASGLLLREADKALTMRVLLKNAEVTLRDPKSYHEERCLLQLQKVSTEINRLLKERTKEILRLINQKCQLKKMCDSVKGILNAGGYRVETKLVFSKLTIEKLDTGIAGIRNQILEIEDKSRELTTQILMSQAMSPLIKLREDIASLNDGSLAAEVEVANDVIRERLIKMEDSVNNLHQNLLIEAGVEPISIEEKKPSGLLE